jgi:hypothetical protein
MKELKINRPTLGPFMSVVCFRYLHDDAEELAGQALIIDAGRQRGRDLIEGMQLECSNQCAEEIQNELHKALGPDGTRLCLIESVVAKDNGGYEVRSFECASPKYTLGVLIGAISSITGKTMLGHEMEVIGKEDVEGRVYHIDPL